MKYADVMKILEDAGVEAWQSIMSNHGIRGPAFGVRYADLYKLQKKLQPDTPLAQELFTSGNHDARILATMIVDPEDLTSRDLDGWIRDVDNYVLNDAVAGVASRSNLAVKKADAWRKVRGEYKSAAGWDVVASLARPASPAARRQVPDAWLSERLDEIEAGIHDAPNRTRHAMNQALIAIGGHRSALRPKALRAAKAIGKVEVDHGKTSCKTPDAAGYIRKLVARAKKNTATTKKKTKKRVGRKSARRTKT